MYSYLLTDDDEEKERRAVRKEAFIEGFIEGFVETYKEKFAENPNTLSVEEFGELVVGLVYALLKEKISIGRIVTYTSVPAEVIYDVARYFDIRFSY